MRKAESLGRVLLASLAVVALIVGMAALINDTQAKKPGGGGGPCICPMVYAPVLCDNGKIYSNQCVADCRGGENCVPIGPGPVPL